MDSQQMVDNLITALHNKMTLTSSLQVNKTENNIVINICVIDNPYHDDTLFLLEIDFERKIVKFFKSYRSCFKKVYDQVGIDDYLKVMDKWESGDYINLPLETFIGFMNTQFKFLSSTLSEMIKLTIGFGYGKQITEKIVPLIKTEHKQNAYIKIARNASSNNSIVINLDNNSWRNGFIQGEIFFAGIKADGKSQYMLFKNKNADYFSKLNIKYTANSTEIKNDMIRINLSDFKNLLDSPTNEFVQIINSIYLDNIAFPEFGCCSKYLECKKEGQCLHVDRLYSTACQYRKILGV